MHGYPGTPVGQLFGNQRRLGVAPGQVAQGQPLPSSHEEMSKTCLTLAYKDKFRTVLPIWSLLLSGNLSNACLLHSYGTPKIQEGQTTPRTNVHK